MSETTIFRTLISTVLRLKGRVVRQSKQRPSCPLSHKSDGFEAEFTDEVLPQDDEDA